MPFAIWTDIVPDPVTNPALIPAFPQLGRRILQWGFRTLRVERRRRPFETCEMGSDSSP